MYIARRTQRLPVFLAATLLAFTLVLSGCDLFGSDDESTPSVDRVAVTGTVVPTDFLDTGEFDVSATPLDKAGNGIISSNLGASVRIEHNPSKSRAKAHDIEAQVTVNSTDASSGNDLAVPIVLDGSFSMAGNDPDRNRVGGAKAFIEALDVNPTPFEAAVYEFPGSNTPPPPDTIPVFNNTDVFSDFTNGVDSLKSAAEMAQASGSTPMYQSLAEILVYSEQVRPKSNFEKAIVLLADGEPNSDALRDSVCNDSKRQSSPIFAIGLGPASDISDNQSSGAIGVMRDLAMCSGGGYQGLSADSLQVIEEAFAAAATGSAQGSVEFGVTITSGKENFQPGDILRGTLTVESGGQSADGTFQFRIPNPATSTSRSFSY